MQFTDQARFNGDYEGFPEYTDNICVWQAVDVEVEWRRAVRQLQRDLLHVDTVFVGLGSGLTDYVQGFTRDNG